MKRRIWSVVLAALLLFTLCACSEPTQTDEEPDLSQAVEITLSGDSIQCADSTVRIDGSSATITREGVYRLKGRLNDGFIQIKAGKKEKVRLILDGAEIRSQSFAPLYVAQADKVFVTLADGSDNVLANGGSFAQIDENNVDAAIFSKDDLTLRGGGKLTVSSPAGHGIVGKDDLVVEGCELTVDAQAQAISGKDSVTVTGGTLRLTAGKDGIHSENSDDTAKGNLCLEDGAYTILAGGDGISASGELQIKDGAYAITTGGGSDLDSFKGVKSGAELLIEGGSFAIDSADDALHSNAGLTITDGEFRISAQDDAIHADGAVSIRGGSIEIEQCREGIEGLIVELSGGKVDITASDDGLNANGEEIMGPGRSTQSDDAAETYVSISGGELHINAGGDGIDSNGGLYVSGGVIRVSGSTNGGNGALDYGTDSYITGGSLIAAGYGEMAVNFGSSSTQGAILINVDEQPADTGIVLKDGSGTVLLQWTAPKKFNCLNLSCPELTQGQTCTLTAGSFTTEITLDSLIYGQGSGFGGGFGGMPGGFGRGGNPQGGQTPPEGFDPSQGGQTPPEGFDPSQGFQPPEGFDPSQGFQPPEGFDPSQGFQPPEGFDPSQGGQPPGGFGGFGNPGERPGGNNP